eukprot:10483291-Alexandrium_andersonii.AAC.1
MVVGGSVVRRHCSRLCLNNIAMRQSGRWSEGCVGAEVWLDSVGATSEYTSWVEYDAYLAVDGVVPSDF